MNVVAFDTETALMGPGAVAPKIMCASFAEVDPETGKPDAILISNGEMDALTDTVRSLLEDDEVTIVCHNAAFDLTVVAANMPQLIPAIFAKLEKGLVTDTKIREKLLNLSTHGKLDMLRMPDGSTEPIKYTLANLVKDYIGRDRSAEKEGDDIWRLNYEALDGLKSSEYPAEAASYARQDALDTLAVYHLQQARVTSDKGPGSVRTAEFHTAVDFALRLQTCWGLKIDQEEVAKIAARVAEELTPEKLSLLIASKILTPAKPPQPYKNGAIDSKTGLPKMRAATKEKVSKKLLQAHVVKVCDKFGVDVKLTAKGGVSTDTEVLQTLAPLDPLIEQYQHRQKLQKLVTTYLPQLEGNDTVHPEYDVLKETGRTSSYAGKLYPSCNIQQVDPRVRSCFVPRQGHVFCAVDYSAIELASFAQVCYSLFGYSVHRDKINAGVDLHAYLGAQLAVGLDSMDAQMGDDAYEYFTAADRDYFGRWRKMAKPTGLGLPGGMGTDTFRHMAKVTYGVDVDIETAERMKEIWFETYPEAGEYFNWIKRNARDPNNTVIDEYGEPEQLYCYLSPMGMYRAGATYCAAANGNGLQTPTAEGAKSGVFWAARAAYDWTQQSVLYGCRPVAFIHDEQIWEIPDDEKKHERAMAISKLMVDWMQRVLPDVVVRVEPALMRRWDKRAKPVYDAQGRLQIWTPSEEQDDGSTKEAAA